MDKKRQINFNLNNFLFSISSAFDEIETRCNKISKNHSKRVAYLAIKLALEFNYKSEALFDLCAYCLMHNIAIKESEDDLKSYCKESNSYASILPFEFKEQKDILKYQCEYYDGSGVFSLKKEQIPLFSQFLSFAILLDRKFDLGICQIEKRQEILRFIKQNENKLFSSDLVECFEDFSKSSSFWLDLKNESEMLNFIFLNVPDKTIIMDFEELLKISSYLTKLTNKDLKIIQNATYVADFYNFEHKDKQVFLIAASLCNLGKLYIKDKILQKKGKLSFEEYEEIKAYPYYTKKILSNIIGFNDISSLAFKVQEKINAQGYPFKLESKNLSLKERLLALVNIYTSLTSNKEYRKAFICIEALKIMENMALNGHYDISLVEDLKKIFIS